MAKMPVSAQAPFMKPREIQALSDQFNPHEETTAPFILRRPTRFVLAALRRRKLLTPTVFLLVTAAPVHLLRLLSQNYHIGTRVLAHTPSPKPASTRQRD